MDAYDKIKEIIEEYEKKLFDLLIEQKLKKEFPKIYPYSRFCFKKREDKNDEDRRNTNR